MKTFIFPYRHYVIALMFLSVTAIMHTLRRCIGLTNIALLHRLLVRSSHCARYEGNDGVTRLP